MALNPAAYEPWKRRRLAAGMPLSAIEAMRPKPAPTGSFDYPPIDSPNASAPGIGPVAPGTGLSLKSDVMDMGEMLPGMQSQEASAQSAAAMGFTNPNRLREGKIDPIRAAESMAEFERTGGKSPFGNTPGIFQGSGPPVAPGGPAVPGASPSIPPGALANGFDPRFMNKPKVPLWR